MVNLTPYFKLYLEYISQEKRLSSLTVSAYKKDLLEFFNTLKGDSLSTGILSYENYLFSKNYAVKTIRRKLTVINAFFHFVNSEDHSLNLPSITLPRQEKLLPKQLFYKDISNLIKRLEKLNAPLKFRHIAILEVLIGTGIRVSELVDLRINNVDFFDKTLEVRGKGDKSRVIPFTDKISNALKSYLELCRPALLKSKTSKYMFLSSNGNPLSRQDINRFLKEWGYESATPHKFRHTFATLLLDNGADLLDVQQLLGHQSINSTQVYTSVTRNHLLNTYKKAHPRS